MDPVLEVALPVFALLAAGLAARRCGIVDAAGVAGLNAFVYHAALPALFLIRLAEVPAAAAIDGRMVLAYLASGAAVFTLAAASWRAVARRRAPELAVVGGAAAYPNNAYMGLALALGAFGDRAAVPTMVIVVADLVVTVSAIVVLLESGAARRGAHPLRAVVSGLARNPMLLGGLAGAALGTAGVELPGPLRTLGEMLGAAALPCGLFAVGAALVIGARGVALAELAGIAALKLVVHPACAWGAATLLGLDGWLRALVMLQTAMPTAATVYVIAQRYERDVERAAGAVAATTALSVVTATVLMLALSR
jgi:predicted permease